MFDMATIRMMEATPAERVMPAALRLRNWRVRCNTNPRRTNARGDGRRLQRVGYFKRERVVVTGVKVNQAVAA